MGYVRVPDGETCTLVGTKPADTIKVESDATLKATRVKVQGNVYADGVTISDNDIDGCCKENEPVGGGATSRATGRTSAKGSIDRLILPRVPMPRPVLVS